MLHEKLFYIFFFLFVIAICWPHLHNTPALLSLGLISFSALLPKLLNSFVYLSLFDTHFFQLFEYLLIVSIWYINILLHFFHGSWLDYKIYLPTLQELTYFFFLFLVLLEVVCTSFLSTCYSIVQTTSQNVLQIEKTI